MITLINPYSYKKSLIRGAREIMDCTFKFYKSISSKEWIVEEADNECYSNLYRPSLKLYRRFLPDFVADYLVIRPRSDRFVEGIPSDVNQDSLDIGLKFSQISITINQP